MIVGALQWEKVEVSDPLQLQSGSREERAQLIGPYGRVVAALVPEDPQESLGRPFELSGRIESDTVRRMVPRVARKEKRAAGLQGAMDLGQVACPLSEMLQDLRGDDHVEALRIEPGVELIGVQLMEGHGEVRPTIKLLAERLKAAPVDADQFEAESGIFEETSPKIPWIGSGAAGVEDPHPGARPDQLDEIADELDLRGVSRDLLELFKGGHVA
jgi:hypothetical protein